MRWFSRAYLSISPTHSDSLMLSQAMRILSSFRRPHIQLPHHALWSYAPGADFPFGAVEPIFQRVHRYFGSFSQTNQTHLSSFMYWSYMLRIFTALSDSISFGNSHDRFSRNASDQNLSDLGQLFSCHTLGCSPQPCCFDSELKFSSPVFRIGH
jgi:hypothetical protein